MTEPDERESLAREAEEEPETDHEGYPADFRDVGGPADFRDRQGPPEFRTGTGRVTFAT
jgi:hypothetical protein